MENFVSVNIEVSTIVENMAENREIARLVYDIIADALYKIEEIEGVVYADTVG